MNARVDWAQPGAAAGSVFLLPGQWWFGAAPARLATLLGSCVAVALWHPRLRIGGMCHYLLPARPRGDAPLDGRYGDEAIELLRQALARSGAQPGEVQAHLLGGANMFANDARVTIDIGARNAAHGRALLDRHGFALATIDVGGAVHRHVSLDLAGGALEVRSGAAA